MTLSDLSKEQKLYMLVGGVVAAVLIGAIVFLINFNNSTFADERMALEDLSGKISRAESELARRPLVSGEFVETVVSLGKYLDSVPPVRNYYSWATEAIYISARTVGLEVASIEQVKSIVSAKEKKAIHLEAYSLRVTAHGSYETVKLFIRDFEAHQPLVRFSGLEISARSEPDEHDVRLSIQWPLSFERFALLDDFGGREPLAVVVAPPRPSGKEDERVGAPAARAPVLVDDSSVFDEDLKPSSGKPEKSLSGQEIPAEEDESPVVDIRKDEAVAVSDDEDSVLVNPEPEPPTSETVLFQGEGISSADGKLIDLFKSQDQEIDDSLGSFFDDFSEGFNE